MSELLSSAAEALGIPEPLVERAAAARAAEAGVEVDEILAAWAGGEAAPSTSPPAEAEPEPETEETPPTEAAAGPEEEEAVSAPEPAAEPEPVPAGVAAARAPGPVSVSPSEAVNVPVVVTVPTAGIKERTSFPLPKWLTAVLLAAPLFALFALGGSATGQCGEATELATEVVTGNIVNCDGSEFTGQVIANGLPDFIAMGEQIYAGCAGCHAPGGGGVGEFPPLTGVLTTFGSCLDHVEWVEKGSEGFRAEGRTTYGDTGRPIQGGMPGHPALSEEQLAAVSAFERVRFAGADRDEVLVDCGLVDPPDEEPEDDEEEDTTESGEDMEAAASQSR